MRCFPTTGKQIRIQRKSCKPSCENRNRAWGEGGLMWLGDAAKMTFERNHGCVLEGMGGKMGHCASGFLKKKENCCPLGHLVSWESRAISVSTGLEEQGQMQSLGCNDTTQSPTACKERLYSSGCRVTGPHREAWGPGKLDKRLPSCP